MCGIIGYIGAQDAAPILLSGLRRLEYRGYDSAGIALQSSKRIRVFKSAGKMSALEGSLPKRLAGKCGIGHTRWATHGVANDCNAHPHLGGSERIALVHNGIIENHVELRAELEARGYVLESETDTEVLAHLIADAPGAELADKVRHALGQVIGTYGIAVMDRDAGAAIVVARNGSPVIVGVGDKEMFVASDVAALVGHTREVVHLDDGEIATVERHGFRITTLDNQPRTKATSTVAWSPESYERGEHEHYMRKEILDQPDAVRRTLGGRLDHRFQTTHLGGLELNARELLDVRRIKLLGCGSAYYAGMCAAHIIETLARIPADAEPAAEFRYRNPVIEADTLYIAISQSGETLDTMMAVQEIRRRGGRVLGIVNVVGSSIAREVDGGVYIHAGPEVSVASTKAYTCTVTALALVAIHLARVRDMSLQMGRELVEAMAELPERIEEALELEAEIEVIAKHYADRPSAFFIGRGIGYPIALEGAQKLKEISYIHAEAYPASELKHGPLALITPKLPTVVALPKDLLFDKSIASIQEIKARRGPVIAITNAHDERIEELADHVVVAPQTLDVLAPIVMGIPMQLLAYHAARHLGHDIDQPRNLAKSVTVE